ncbi:hypothetical protein JOM56_005362 [Amanita muscaria]
MSATIVTTPYTSSTSAMFDAGRQPLATLQFNTPEPKRSVKVRKHTDIFFCPRAVNPWANLARSPVKAKDVPKTVEVPKQIAEVFFSPRVVSLSADITYTPNEGDVEDLDDADDIPIGKLMALSSLTTGPSTLKRVPRVKERVGPKDSGDPDDEDLPLSRVVELMVKLGRRPTPIQFIPKHTLLRPATIPMTCIASNCPFDWHDHVDTAASH